MLAYYSLCCFRYMIVIELLSCYGGRLADLSCSNPYNLVYTWSKCVLLSTAIPAPTVDIRCCISRDLASFFWTIAGKQLKQLNHVTESIDQDISFIDNWVVESWVAAVRDPRILYWLAESSEAERVSRILYLFNGLECFVDSWFDIRRERYFWMLKSTL